jgi:hypothetical protein
MAFKQQIPQSWIKQRPNAANLGHIYNLHDSVGLNCTNKKLDVMLLQVLLSVWADWRQGRPGTEGIVSAYEAGNESVRTAQLSLSLQLGKLSANGVCDNRLIAWIFFYQLYHFKHDGVGIAGKVNAAKADGSSLADARHTLLHLNVQIKSTWPQVFADLAGAPGVPADLASALKTMKT